MTISLFLAEANPAESCTTQDFKRTRKAETPVRWLLEPLPRQTRKPTPNLFDVKCPTGDLGGQRTKGIALPGTSHVRRAQPKQTEDATRLTRRELSRAKATTVEGEVTTGVRRIFV